MTMKYINDSLLIQALKNPNIIKDLSIPQWNRLLFEAHGSSLTARLAEDCKANALWQDLPSKVQQIFEAAQLNAEASQRKIKWEMERIRRALFGVEGKIILLKGAAYIALELGVCRGRISADIDILVAKNQLDLVEDRMLKNGWQHHVLNEYDQKYYRDWAHELPPLKHPDRQLEVDIHHNILPQTSRLHPDINLMIEEAVCIDGAIHSLSPVHMLLHSAVHLFQDGEIRGSLRNLLEQHDMLNEFGEDERFWQDLICRARHHGLIRPLYYCLQYCEMFLQTKIPEAVTLEMEKHRPAFLTRKMMDFMVSRSMLVPWKGQSAALYYLCCKILYMRSHWLRMPPGLLMRHLLSKLIRRLKGKP